MEDIHGRNDERGIAIPCAGVSDLRYPMRVAVAGSTQSTVGVFKMSVSLSAGQKGTHMSRFVEVLHALASAEILSTIDELVHQLRVRLVADHATIEVEFPFFVKRAAPVTGSEALLEFRGRVRATTEQHGTATELGVSVPITTVCACSKAISDYGAHNQRGTVTITVRTTTEIGLHELVDYAEASVSCRVYPLVKRADERHITMRAFDHPQFVEDVVRDVSLFLQADPRIEAYSVDVTNTESIHNHSAFASPVWMRAACAVGAATSSESAERYG